MTINVKELITDMKAGVVVTVVDKRRFDPPHPLFGEGWEYQVYWHRESRLTWVPDILLELIKKVGVHEAFEAFKGLFDKAHRGEQKREVNDVKKKN